MVVLRTNGMWDAFLLLFNFLELNMFIGFCLVLFKAYPGQTLLQKLNRGIFVLVFVLVQFFKKIKNGLFHPFFESSFSSFLCLL
jgi:hypothetical protein